MGVLVVELLKHHQLHTREPSSRPARWGRARTGCRLSGHVLFRIGTRARFRVHCDTDIFAAIDARVVGLCAQSRVFG